MSLINSSALSALSALSVAAAIVGIFIALSTQASAVPNFEAATSFQCNGRELQTSVRGATGVVDIDLEPFRIVWRTAGFAPLRIADRDTICAGEANECELERELDSVGPSIKLNCARKRRAYFSLGSLSGYGRVGCVTPWARKMIELTDCQPR